MNQPREQAVPPCGTMEAYRRHRRRGEPFDAACRAAQAAYMREYRAKNGTRRQVETEKQRRHALMILAGRHQEEYEEILRDVRVAAPPLDLGTSV